MNAQNRVSEIIVLSVLCSAVLLNLQNIVWAVSTQRLPRNADVSRPENTVVLSRPRTRLVVSQTF